MYSKATPFYRNSCLLCVALTTTELLLWKSDKRKETTCLWSASPNLCSRQVLKFFQTSHNTITFGWKSGELRNIISIIKLQIYTEKYIYIIMQQTQINIYHNAKDKHKHTSHLVVNNFLKFLLKAWSTTKYKFVKTQNTIPSHVIWSYHMSLDLILKMAF